MITSFECGCETNGKVWTKVCKTHKNITRAVELLKSVKSQIERIEKILIDNT